MGAVERSEILPLSKEICDGDILLGLPSSGVHSNGFSLVRHVISKRGLNYHDPCPFEAGMPLGEALLTPTRIYVKAVLPLLKKRLIKGMAHITGGGVVENLPRVLPKGILARMNANAWPLLPVFKWLKKAGNISECELQVVNGSLKWLYYSGNASYFQLWIGHGLDCGQKPCF